jgi:hypothetical protein
MTTTSGHISEMDSVDLWAKAYACSHMLNMPLVFALRAGRDLPSGWRGNLSLAFIALAAFERRLDDSIYLSTRGERQARAEHYHESRDWGGLSYEADQQKARGL